MQVSQPPHDRAVFAIIAVVIALLEVGLLLLGIASLGLWLWFTELNALSPGV